MIKLRLKFSNTQKFNLSFDEEDPTLHDLKIKIISFIRINYLKERSNIDVSFNGRDAITGDDSATLESFGVVNGDLLIIIESSNAEGSSLLTTLETNEVKMDPSSSSDSSHSISIARNPDRLFLKVTSLLEAVDGMPPQTVEDAFNRYNPSTESQFMNLLIHLAIAERGFVIDDDSNISLPISWKEMVTSLTYRHSTINDFKCTITIVTMGDVKQVLASFQGQETEISVRLEVKNYIPSQPLMTSNLTKLSQLAKTIRNQLLHPLQVAAHLTLGLPAPWHLIGLPQELLINIIGHLPLKDIFNASSCCKRLNASCQDNKLWFILFKRDFKHESHSSDTLTGSDWKSKYKDLFVRRKQERMEKVKRDTFMPSPFAPNPEMPPHGPFPDIDPYNPYMPHPRAPNPYPPDPNPYPNPNPFYDPDSPYFGGEIPPMPGPFFPHQPTNPFGPRQPQNPLQPPFMPPRRRFPRGGPRFDFL